jgi:hypothetical protein
MSYPWILIFAILALGIAYVLFPWMAHVFARYRRPRLLRCPETGTKAWVEVDAPHAALTAAFGKPDVRAKECSLWADRGACAESCLKPDQAQVS